MHITMLGKKFYIYNNKKLKKKQINAWATKEIWCPMALI